MFWELQATNEFTTNLYLQFFQSNNLEQIYNAGKFRFSIVSRQIATNENFQPESSKACKDPFPLDIARCRRPLTDQW